jgi:hypothetical protein
MGGSDAVVGIALALGWSHGRQQPLAVDAPGATEWCVATPLADRECFDPTEAVRIMGASPDVTDRILEARSRAFASPDVGAVLTSILSEAGFVDVRPSELHLATTTLDVALRAFRLEAGAAAAVTGGTISSAEAAGWLHSPGPSRLEAPVEQIDERSLELPGSGQRGGQPEGREMVAPEE